MSVVGHELKMIGVYVMVETQMTLVVAVVSQLLQVVMKLVVLL